MNMMKSELLSILPQRWRPLLRDELLEEALELRLRCGRPMTLVCRNGSYPLNAVVTQEDLRQCVNTASRYSPWNAATIRDGYLTAPGGHRIGLCGETAGEGIRHLSSLCIRVARDIPDLGGGILLRESTLILGPPGSGKTTLLRCLIRRLSDSENRQVAVVDERCEIFPMSGGKLCFDPGKNTDVLSGRDKPSGIDQVLRAMGPEWIALDEITSEDDCNALVRSGWCGVKLLATVHAARTEDLYSRPVYRPLIETGLFRSVIIMRPDKSCHQERI